MDGIYQYYGIYYQQNDILRPKVHPFGACAVEEPLFTIPWVLNLIVEVGVFWTFSGCFGT